MADATLNSPESDPITSMDVHAIHIFPADQQVIVELSYVRQSGTRARTVTERFDGADFVSCVASFCQAVPKKKLLQYIVDKGRLQGVTLT